MRNYFYCDKCSELIHKDCISNLDGNDVCPFCYGDVEHSEDVKEESPEIIEPLEEELLSQLNSQELKKEVN